MPITIRLIQIGREQCRLRQAVIATACKSCEDVLTAIGSPTPEYQFRSDIQAERILPKNQRSAHLVSAR